MKLKLQTGKDLMLAYVCLREGYIQLHILAQARYTGGKKDPLKAMYTKIKKIAFFFK